MNSDIDQGIQDIMRRYGKRISSQMEDYDSMIPTDEAFSKEYEIFRNEAIGTGLSVYEKMAQWAGDKISVAVKPQDREEIQAAIDTTHLDVTPEEAASLASLFTIGFVFLAILVGLSYYLITGGINLSVLVLSLIILLIGFLILKPMMRMPLHIAAKWRLKAGNQMVLCVLYMVMYLRHTSNLEHAIKFAGEHIGNPLALDLRKVFWDVETGKFSTIKESLDNYLEKWRKWNLEFIESIHLIQSSLFEPSEERRLERLEKSLQIMIEGTYERMLHFAHDVKSPITVLHMLGIILPILGLIILPLMGSFLGVKWWHLSIVYNIILPVIVYRMGMNILEKRPMGYGERDILEEEPQFAEYAKADFMGMKVDPLFPAITIGFIFCLIGLLPLIIHFIDPSWDMMLTERLGFFLDYRDKDSGLPCTQDSGCLGPFGIGAVVLSLFFTLGLALGFGTYYRLKTKNLIIIREKSKELEKEFSGSLFQLGNRIGDGIPSELAFGKVAQNMKGTPTGDFLSIVNRNIRQLGMNVKDAIFDSQRGAILAYPSSLIESSMKVLVESARKGPKIVAQSLISISVYIEKIHRVGERLKDLLADVTSSMKGQITFLTPMIAGVVVGIGSMITSIIGKLGQKIGAMTGMNGEGVDTSAVPLNIQNLVKIFPTDKLMPPFFFQIVVGIYVVEIIFILTILSNAIQNGMDSLSEKNLIGKHLLTSVFFYFIVSLVITLIFSFLAGVIAQFNT